MADGLPDATIEEETWLQGAFLSQFCYGIQTTLFIFAFVAILQRRTLDHRRIRIGLLTYVAVLFVVTTTAQGLLLAWIQMGFISQRDYPGGSSAFLNNDYSLPINIACTILFVCANWMMECLLVWRCYVVCSSGGEELWWLSVIVPFLMLIAVVVAGSLYIHFTLHSITPARYSIAYGTSSLVLNVTATGLIAARLLIYRRQVVSQLGRGHGRHYVSIAAVVIESAAIYTSMLVGVIVAYALNSPATNLLQQVIGQVQTIASLLIILRITRGDGWTTSTDTKLASAAVSSWNTRTGRLPEQTVIHLEVVSMQRVEEASGSRKEDERTDWLCKDDGRLDE